MSLKFDIKKIVKFKGNGTYHPPKKDGPDNKEEKKEIGDR